MLDIYKIIEKTNVEGPGLRFCIWTQGCRKHCAGCWAKNTWSFGTGKKYSVEELFEKIKLQPGIEGITLLGGEPFEQAKELSKLAVLVKNEGMSVVCFTGYTMEELQHKNNPYINNLLLNIDLLIDGGFEQKNYNLSRPWVGSSNQRYIFLTDFYNKEVIANYTNKIEIRISPDGKTEINGMGDFSAIYKSLCLQLGKNIVK